jgi:hypothetical protein
MDKRLAKRHKRQVARAAERVKISEPDVRTPEQIQEAREASRATVNHVSNSSSVGSAPNNRGNRPPASGSAAKTSV